MPAPGVVVTTAVRSGPAGTPRADSGQFFVIGLAERGPTVEPARLNSMGDYRRLFGERITYGSLFDSLALFFETGGAQAHVLRVVGPAATVGFVNGLDGAGVPLATVRIDAASAGSWSSQITVQFSLGTNGVGTRRVTVRLAGVVVEEYDSLTNVASIVTRFSRSPYVRFTDLGSATLAPNNMPTAAAPLTLSAGTDDRAAVTTTVLTAALEKLKIGLGDGAVAAPGYGETMHPALIAHARAHRRIALLSDTLGSTTQDLIDASLLMQNVAGAEFAGLFGPWVLVSDGVGGTRPVSPEGYVAAARNKAHEAVGPWLPAAGALSVSTYVVGLERDFSRADHDRLDAARVSPIRVVANQIRLYGWRSLSGADADYGSLAVGDLLNRIVTEAELALEPFVFRTIDGRGQIFPQIEGVLIGLLEPIRNAGGIYERVVDGQTLDVGYTVDVGPNLNTVDSLANNEVRAAIAARFSPNAAYITLTIVKVGLSAGV